VAFCIIIILIFILVLLRHQCINFLARCCCSTEISCRNCELLNKAAKHAVCSVVNRISNRVLCRLLRLFSASLSNSALSKVNFNVDGYL
jgi:hypothetical protein